MKIQVPVPAANERRARRVQLEHGNHPRPRETERGQWDWVTRLCTVKEGGVALRGKLHRPDQSRGVADQWDSQDPWWPVRVTVCGSLVGLRTSVAVALIPLSLSLPLSLSTWWVLVRPGNKSASTRCLQTASIRAQC